VNEHDLTQAIRTFARERDWERFHTPKNLAMALAAEVGELVSEFQWLDDTGSLEARRSGSLRMRVTYEIADVAIYLFRLADVLDIDLAEAMVEKLEINTERYPVDRARGNALKYTTWKDDPPEHEPDPD
jgi:dCTP diphosphatase